jgi:undecaprenyl-diphosphatase
VGGTLGVGTLALAWLLAVTVGALSPAGSGAGLVEGVLAVLLWRWGTSAAEAVAAVLLLRVATWWLPIVPGLVATRRLRAEGRL